MNRSYPDKSVIWRTQKSWSEEESLQRLNIWLQLPLWNIWLQLPLWPTFQCVSITLMSKQQTDLMKWHMYDTPIRMSIFGMLSTRIIAFLHVYEHHW